MKNYLAALFVSAFVVCPPLTYAQGLLNGSFELCDRGTHFLPGWHVRLGAGPEGTDCGTVVGGVSGSLLDFERTTSGLFATVYGPTDSAEGLPIGKYWLLARGPATTLEQRFTVPVDGSSLQYRGYGASLGGVSVQIDGVTLEPQVKVIIQPGSSLNRDIEDWWVDMRPYEGREVDLTFYIGQGTAGFDDVRVSTEIVPEPGVLAFGTLGLGALLVGRGRHRRREERGPAL